MLPKNREIIFISHATPEDNDFAIWLASRLQLLGFNVWIDKSYLIGGEKFWEAIDQTIRNNAVKFLLVYSQNICQKDSNQNILYGKLKDGIYKEYSLAESISRQENLNDFIILLNIDGSDSNLFIGADRINQIFFDDNWAIGLETLVKKLQKDNVTKDESKIDKSFAEWYENQYITKNIIVNKYELYYNNWWSIDLLPDSFYIYSFRKSLETNEIFNQFNTYPAAKVSNNLISFEYVDQFTIIHENDELNIKPDKIHQIKIKEIINGYDTNEFPTKKDCQNYLKYLLKRIFHLLMKQRGMFWYEMSSKKLAYYYTPSNLNRLKVKFKYPYRANQKTKTKNLIGKHKNVGLWHFAISAKPILLPKIAFSLKSHLTFTSDGFKVLKKEDGEVDIDKIHTERRSKGRRFFNEEWRDMLVAFLNGLSKNEKIQIPLSKNFTLNMGNIPDFYWSEFGYYDPKDKTRHGLLSAYQFDDEIDDDEEEVLIENE